MTQQETKLDVAARELGTVYAKAFFGAAQSAGETDALVAELETLVSEVVNAIPGFQALFASQLIVPEEKVHLVDRVFAGRVSPRMQDFLKVVAEHDRMGYLREIAHEVRELYNASLGRKRVKVTTAVALDANGMQELTDSVRKQLGCEPDLTNTVDPELLGGVIIRVGDTVYDGSVSNRIRSMRSDLADRYANAIDTRGEELLGEFTEG